LRDLIVVNGSREGLFYAILPAVGRKRIAGKPAVLLPNPYYHAYLGSTSAVNAEPVFLDATEATGHLPDLEALAKRWDVLERTVAFYLCSPANPQGAVASPSYMRHALALARQYDFMLFVDECYSEIYTGEAPTGGLEIAGRTPERFSNIVSFNSLSKRSNLPGLRSGFVAGDPDFIEALAEVRNLTGPQMPGIIQQASIAVWSEEQHVAVIRQAYKAKFDVCDELLKGRFGYRRPAGGFFLWLDLGHLGGSVEATVTLWKRCGVRVVPGAYLAQPNEAGLNPGERYVRVALVHPPATIREALERLVSL
jgi:aspartate/methionine/tyrosine aminotransferase